MSGYGNSRYPYYVVDMGKTICFTTLQLCISFLYIGDLYELNQTSTFNGFFI